MNEEKLTQLERLARLKAQGAITGQEYEEQKAKLITPPRPVSGEHKEGIRKPFLIWGALLVLLVALVFINDHYTIPTQDNPAQELQRKQERDKQAAYILARREIRNSLKDPGSYQEIEHNSFYVGMTPIYVSCIIAYRAKNSFGAYDIERTRVDFNEDMKPIDIKQVED